jgi:hypothetical protein
VQVERRLDLHAARLPARLTGLEPETGRRLTADLRKGA